MGEQSVIKLTYTVAHLPDFIFAPTDKQHVGDLCRTHVCFIAPALLFCCFTLSFMFYLQTLWFYVPEAEGEEKRIHCLVLLVAKILLIRF